MIGHSALIYETRDQFVEQMLPFVQAGVEADEPVFVVTSPDNIAALREGLNGGAERVEFTDSGTWYTRPAETLDRYRAKVEEHAGAGSVRVIGEPTWRGPKGTVREWARYESVINEAFRGVALDLVCPYDASRLPDTIISHALATHPTVMERTQTRASEAYLPAHAFVSAFPRESSPPVRSSVVVTEPSRLGEIRRHVATVSREAGVVEGRIGDVVLAVSEVAANALRHGTPPAHIDIAVENDEIVCEIVDSGEGVRDALAGWLPPPSVHEGGWGLVIARRLSDALEFGSNGQGATVTLRFAVP